VSRGRKIAPALPQLIITASVAKLEYHCSPIVEVGSTPVLGSIIMPIMMWGLRNTGGVFDVAGRDSNAFRTASVTASVSWPKSTLALAAVVAG